MPSGRLRDLGALAPRVEAWLRARFPDRIDLRIGSLRHASAGLSNETVLVDTSWRGGSARLVFRLAAIEPTFPDFDLSVQAQVQRALARVGLPVPAPVLVEADAGVLGTPFLAMPFVAGHVGPQAAPFDPWIASLAPPRRHRVCDSFVALLARLHGLDVTATGLGRVLRGTGRTLADEVAWWEAYVRWAGEGDDPPTAVADLLAWCRANVPATAPEPAVLWGDPRLGNAVFDDDQRVAAALDWDMACVGPPEHDLGWYLGLEEVVARVAGGPVEGFPARAEAIAAYETGLGRRVRDFEWYEIFALVRSVAITLRQRRIATRAGVEYPVPPPEGNPVVTRARELIAGAG